MKNNKQLTELEMEVNWRIGETYLKKFQALRVIQVKSFLT